jgi:hypothetical protein
MTISTFWCSLKGQHHHNSELRDLFKKGHRQCTEFQCHRNVKIDPYSEFAPFQELTGTSAFFPDRIFYTFQFP